MRPARGKLTALSGTQRKGTKCSTPSGGGLNSSLPEEAKSHEGFCPIEVHLLRSRKKG